MYWKKWAAKHHAKERAEPKQPVQAPEEPMGAVSSCGRVDPFEERFGIGQQDRPFPSHEWLEDWSRARCTEMSQWTVLVTGPPGTGKTDGVRLLVSGLLICEQNTLTRHIFWCLSALMIMSHTTLAQGVGARHTIQVSCACVFDLSSTLSSHSSLVSPILYFIFLIFHLIFHVDRFGAKSPVRFRE